MSIKILQYNVNKSRNKVLAGLLADPRVADFDIIAIQEPWRNTYDSSAYNTRDSGFHLVDKKDGDSRVSMYINKRISTDSWSEVSHSLDSHTITLRVGTTQINIHNVYSPPPASHTDNSELNALAALTQALRMEGEHVIVGDFNLHHPLWGGPAYQYQHTVADTLLDTMRNAGVELALPQGTITREAMRGDIVERTTIDLIWLSADLMPRLIQCRVARELEQSSDHLPIITWIQTEVAYKVQATRRRRAWKLMDTEKFNKEFI